MSTPVRWFLRSAVVWLAAGMGMGIWMGADPSRTLMLRAAHMHALLPGFVLFMIFGVAYHVLPRFSGRPLPWAAGPLVHLILANAGLAMMVAGFVLRVGNPDLARLLVPLGGGVILAGALLFIHAVWRLTEHAPWTS